MAYPRSILVDSATAGTYHCVTRCVRRAYLCGQDDATGRCFDHRKDWLEARVLELAGIFSASVLAFAVMSNHVHVVVHVDPGVAWGWSASEVAERWLRLFPLRRGGEIDPEVCRRRADAIAGNAERVDVLRERLSSLSWFMRCLAEPLARTANREDGCSGRFWEGRFKCQALLDEAAVLACMAYVDLNPVRAGIAEDLPSSAHTSIKRRLEAPATCLARPLQPVAGPAQSSLFALTAKQYVAMVDWAGRQLHPGKRGRIAEHAPAALRKIAPAEEWLHQVRGIESRYWRAVGSAQALLEKARDMGQRWLKLRRLPVVLPA